MLLGGNPEETHNGAVRLWCILYSRSLYSSNVYKKLFYFYFVTIQGSPKVVPLWWFGGDPITQKSVTSISHFSHVNPWWGPVLFWIFNKLMFLFWDHTPYGLKGPTSTFLRSTKLYFYPDHSSAIVHATVSCWFPSPIILRSTSCYCTSIYSA